MKFITKSSGNNTLPAVSTASLPDIVFILLFFFMTVTVFNDKNLLVENTLPNNASESEQLADTKGVIEFYIGKPLDEFTGRLGSQPRIQLKDRLVALDDFASVVLTELSKMPEAYQKIAMVSIKVDKDVSLGIINDIKEELRKINVLKVHYATVEGENLTTAW